MNFLPWLIPPVVGALIGYVTNAVAIKMLFRPLKEVRVLGIRLPFTPGILPRQRHKLADSIGGMVERELLTAEVLSARLKRPEVRDGLKNSIGAFTEKILSMPSGDLLKPLASFAEKDGLLSSIFSDFLKSPGSKILFDTFAESSASLFNDYYPRALTFLAEYLHRNEVHRTLELQGYIFLTRVLRKMNVFQRFFISAGQYDKTLEDKMPEIIDDLINQAFDLLSGDDFRSNIQGLLSNAIRSFLSGDAVTGATPGVQKMFLEKLPDKITGSAGTLREFLALEDGKKNSLDIFLAEKLIALAEAETSAILASINVRALVSDRIDALEMVKVERIVLDVMASQLKWINIFGAILGTLIGISQLFFIK
ncbi:UPF0754 membrane protein [Spirochaetia bacterium]|nr:UPF0754 membrane protein [Spirochaetia bacterium]